MDRRDDFDTREERPIEALRRRQQAARREAMEAVSSGEGPSKRTKIKTADLEREVRRAKAARQKTSAAKSLLISLLCAVALAVILTIYFFPALTLEGQSMEPALHESELVLTFHTDNIRKGDLLAFSYNNEVMVKRVIATGGDTVDIKENGTVYVNGAPIDEPYVEKLSLDPCNIDLPLTVPDGKFFVLGDHREVSEDSRSREIGTVAKSQIVGKLLFRLWPVSVFGRVS